MSNKRIEDLSIGRLTDAIYENDNLEPYISSNDKTPSWDGSIIVYKREPHSNENMMGKIPVQVKGTEQDCYEGESIKYPIEVSDLNNYLDDGGILFFVIKLGTIKNTKIYFANLLPLEIKKYIDKKVTGQKSISVEMEKLDKEQYKMLKGICVNFLINRRYQSSTYSYARKIEDFKQFFIPISSAVNEFKDYVMNNPVYMYGRTSPGDVPIPIEKLMVESILAPVEENISIGSEIYYDTYRWVYKKQERLILIGNDIYCNINEQSMDFNFTGSLSERLRDAKFICDIIDTKAFNLGEELVNNIRIDDDVAIDVQKYYKSLTNVKGLLDYFKVEEDLQLDKMTNQDYANLNLLINIILYNKKVKLSYISEGLVKIKIANLMLGIVVSFDIEGYVRMENLFSEEFNQGGYYLKVPDDPNKYDSSIYVVLNSSDIVKMSNINVEIIKSTITSVEYSVPYSKNINQLILQFIIAYDNKATLIDCLNAALDLVQWLEVKEPMYFGHKLNRLQIYKRQRELTTEEVSFLVEAKCKEEEFDILCGICILLDNINEFEYYFNKLSPEEQDYFKTYPIYHFIKNQD